MKGFYIIQPPDLAVSSTMSGASNDRDDDDDVTIQGVIYTTKEIISNINKHQEHAVVKGHLKMMRQAHSLRRRQPSVPALATHQKLLKLSN
jgi:hypothetical protein